MPDRSRHAPVLVLSCTTSALPRAGTAGGPAMTALDALLSRALDAVAAGGGPALFLVMLLETVLPPIPSEAVLPLAGFAVRRGMLPMGVALGAATAGSVAGAWMLYAAGRFGGRPALDRFGWLLRLDERGIARATAWFDRRGPALVLWARVVPLARSGVSFPAGVARMPFWRFTALTACGSLAWNAVLLGAGMLVGQRWEAVAGIVGRYGTAVLVLATAVAVALVLRAWSAHRRRNAVGTADTGVPR